MTTEVIVITIPHARRLRWRILAALFCALTLASVFSNAAGRPAVVPMVNAVPADSSVYTGNATNFDSTGAPTYGCGVPQANLDSQNFVALNVWNTPGNYSSGDGSPTARPIPASAASMMGRFDNGHNCGRWVRVSIADYCTGINDGQAGMPFCRNGSWISDQYNGATLDMLVADSCGDANAWCRDDANHLDLSTNALNQFQLNGQSVGNMYPNSWNNRQISWSYIPAPDYSGDISIGFAANASVWWPAIAITHLPNGIHNVDYYNGSTWVPARMNGDNGQVYVLGPNTSGGTSYTIRVYDANDSLVQGGRTYTFSLPEACSSACSQPYTGVSYITNGGGGSSVPGAPTNLSVTGTTANSVSLSWAGSSGATGYTVYRNGQSVGSTAGTTYTDSGLTASTAYTYTVGAYNSAGTSAASNSVVATTQSSGGGGSGCTASLQVSNSWPGGFTGHVTVTNTGTSTTNSWTVGWNWSDGQQVTQYWSTDLAQSGTAITASNVSYNNAIAPAGNTAFGFTANGSSTGLPSNLTCTTG